MNTVSSQIIARALSLADLQNNTNISYQDKTNSLNEAYKDLYDLMLDSDDDYYYTELNLAITPAMQSPTESGGLIEYLVPLPSDFMRLRSLEYMQSGYWIQLEKYTWNQKGSMPSNPMYRIRGNNLHIVGSSYNSILSSLRLGYYPMPQNLNLPAPSISIGSFNLSWATQTALISPCFTGSFYAGGNINQAAGSIGRVVYYNGTSIVCEDEDTLTITVLQTVANVIQVVYYWGYIYYLTSTGSIYRFQTDLQSIGVPSLVITPANTPVEFGLITTTPANTPNNYSPGYLLWCTDGSTYTNLYTATGATVYTIAKAYTSFFACGGYWVGLDTSGALWLFTGITFLTGTAIPYPSPIQQAWSDGTFIYAALQLTTSIHKLTIASGVISSDFVLTTDALVTTRTNNVYNGMLSYQQMDFSWNCISLAEDTPFNYPNNLVPELISYQAAIDFSRKQHADTSGLEERFQSLFNRYKDGLQRDNYKNERIQNAYSNRWGR